LQSYLDEIMLLTDIAGQEGDQINAIKLMTIHASKWLEFPTIFLVGLEDNLCPMQDARLDDRKMKEERRLIYISPWRGLRTICFCHTPTQEWHEVALCPIHHQDLSKKSPKNWSNPMIWTVRHHLVRHHIHPKTLGKATESSIHFLGQGRWWKRRNESVLFALIVSNLVWEDWKCVC